MIYYCIPCHNEERTVGIVLWKIRQVMADLPRDYQILVADDGSSDRSFTVLEPYARVLPLTLMGTTSRRGYAATLEMLLREAVRRSDYPKRDAIVVLQADFTDDPEFAGALLRKLESGADIAIGEPVAASRPRIVYRLARRVAGRRGWPAEIRDPIHGFNAFRLICVRKALEARQERRLLTCEGWAANAELLQAALPHARRIESVEILTHPERLQRRSRVAAVGALREAWRFGGGTEGRPRLSPAELVPDRTHGDRAALRPDREAVAERPSAQGQRDGRKTAGSERRSRGPRDGRPARSRSGTRSSSGEDAGRGQKAETPGSGAGRGSRDRAGQRKRSRRGGGTKDRSTVAKVEHEATPGAVAEQTDASGERAVETGGTADSGQPGRSDKPRRRRGRRGGRRRRSGGSGSGTNDANAGAGGESPENNGGKAAAEPE